MSDKYIPGICNIGPAEIRYRKILSFIGYFLFFLFLLIFIAFDTTPLLRISLAFPAALQSVNYLQVVNKFCAGFGVLGVYNLDKEQGETTKVTNDEFLKKDKQKAMSIIRQSAIISVLAGIAGYLTSYINFDLFF